MAATRLQLAHLPTPITRSDALDALVGTQVWLKRDDMTAGAAAGNKIRKLEYLLADACEQEATVVVTCGGYQSNHARATTLLARQLGMRAVLLLRATRPNPVPDRGNAFLDALAGADIRPITPAQYADRMREMEAVAQELRAAGERPYVIPEGGSNGIGALGYVHAMAEIREQLDAGVNDAPDRFDAVAHACGSGGTAAGALLGCAAREVAPRVLAMAVCDDRSYFEATIDRIVAQARALLDEPHPQAALRVLDAYKGPAYGIASDEQRRFIAQAARACGLVLDPVYSGKALFGLSRMPDKPRRVLFIHTGGLPGLLAQADEFGLQG